MHIYMYAYIYIYISLYMYTCIQISFRPVHVAQLHGAVGQSVEQGRASRKAGAASVNRLEALARPCTLSWVASADSSIQAPCGGKPDTRGLFQVHIYPSVA